ncbi:amidohydrolase [Tsuneonella deserti]|uniref:Amidohydrolase n=1 Tax=Tsuneonella deserti TaxID=2035528 RepID=A0ABQ1S1A5_9SPHN|nr:amidohydrolase family protein [Tsuneonella deserti]GGD87668.1 amidohydrolase [Tsuneonella deserti]
MVKKGRRLRQSVAGPLLALALAGTASAQTPPPNETAPPARVSDQPTPLEPAPSGLPPTPPARPSQTLPLVPARTAEFTVEEVTGLQPDIAPDGRTIVFAILGDIYLLDASGGEAKAITRGLAVDTQPAFSPDGRWIAFLSDRSGAENLWVMRPDGSEARQVTLRDDDPIFASPAWSADGRTLLVSRYRPDRNAYELWRYRVEGGAGEVVVANRPDGADGPLRHALGAVATADGQWIYFAAREGDLDLAEPVEWRIARMPAGGGASETVVSAVGDIRLGKVQSSAFRPALSHDGHLLAYVQRRVGKTWLRLRNLGSGEERDLTELDPDSLQASYWSDVAPHVAFAPDDGSLIFARAGKLARFKLADGAIIEIPFTAKVEQQLGPLTRAPVRVETGPVRARIVQAPALSPDGRTFAFSALGKVYTMPAAGGPPTAIAPDLPPQFHPAWSADSKRLLFVTWTGPAGGHVWETRIGAGKPSRLTERDAFYTHPVYAPDGSVIVVRSPSAERRAHYVEFGQIRDAELVSLKSGAVLSRGLMGGTPHFLGDDTLLINRSDGVHRADDDARIASVVGPNWYFAEGSAQADDLRVSPDGRHALAQIAQQLFLVSLPNDAAPVDLSDGGAGHEKLTDVGADYFGWSADGREMFWSVGSTLARRELAGGGVSSVEAVVTAPRDMPAGHLLLRGATVLSMGPAGAMEDADLLVDGNRIAAIGPRGSLAVPEGTSVRDVSGSFVIPGLVDVHDHVADIRRDVLDFAAWGPAANLAYGVTTAFDPSTLTIDMLAYQDALDAGLTTGSRIFSTGTAIFAFNDFRSPEQVDAVLRRYRDRYRLSNVKMYRSGNRRVREWIAQSALTLGIQPTTEGALAAKLDLSHILDGYSGNEHAIPPPVLHDDMVQLLARSGTSYDLTLQITHGGYPAQDFFIARDAPHDDPKYARFAPPWFRDQKFWQREWRDPSGYLFPRIAASALAVKRAGGLVSIGAHGEVPGLGTHWEMEAHQMGGWTPVEVLEAATIQGARTIGRDADLGSLEPGKVADLVVLDKDPRLDIANTRAIAWVMKNGRLYAGDDLAQVWPVAAPPPEFWFSPPAPHADAR